MFIKFVNFFLNTTFIFFPPIKSDLILYDYQSKNIISKIFKIRNFKILFTRKEKINLFILLKTLLKFQFSYFDYIINYIKYCGGKILVTSIDNNYNFYKIKSRLNIITIFFQNGERLGRQDIFQVFENKNKLKYYKSINAVDLMFVFNKMTADLYQKLIFGETFVTGSLLSNINKISKKSNKDLIYISLFRKNTKLQFRNNTIKLVKILNEYCIKNDLKFKILGKFRNDHLNEEKNFYKKILGQDLFFIYNSKKRNSYKIIDEAKICISPGSTLGIENLGRKNKTILINAKYKMKGYKEVFFGFFTKRKIQGPFWYNGLNKKIIFKLIDKVLGYKENKWKEILKDYEYETTLYDYKNFKLKRKLIKFFKSRKIEIKKYLR
jgi:surface carbohydrate biosynthesis protein